VTAPVNIRATDDVAHDAALEASLAGASALRAAATGYMAAAGEHPGVLLSGVTILLYGFGAARAFDGRLRQPGLGARRPRGWLHSDEVPDVAWVAAPGNLPALFVALGYDEDHRNAMVFRAGINRAHAAGSDARASLIEHIQDRGGNAWADPQLHRSLLHIAGASQGGMLGRGDFEVTGTLDVAGERLTDEGGSLLRVPWATEAAEPTAGCSVEAVCAIDRRGTAAVIVYERCVNGIQVPDWGLLAPRASQPVIRGVPRIRPGTPRSMPCPAEIRFSGTSTLQCALVSGAAALKVLPPE
jgi:hypothetical protein